MIQDLEKTDPVAPAEQINKLVSPSKLKYYYDQLQQI